MARSKKQETPEVEAELVLVLTGETDNDDALIEDVEALAEKYDGLNIIVSATLAGDADEDDEDATDDESDEDEDADDDEAEPYDEDSLNELGTAELKAILEEFEVELDGRFSKAKAIAAILEAQDDDESDDDDDEDDGDDDEDVIALAEAADDGDEDAADRLTELAEEAGLDINDYPDSWVDLANDLAGDDEDEDEDDDEDVEELDEDALNAMSDAEVKKVYKEIVGSAPKRGMKKAAMIEAIFEAAEADED